MNVRMLKFHIRLPPNTYIRSSSSEVLENCLGSLFQHKATRHQIFSIQKAQIVSFPKSFPNPVLT